MIYSSNTEFSMNTPLTPFKEDLNNINHDSQEIRFQQHADVESNPKLNLFLELIQEHFSNIDFANNQLLYSTVQTFSQNSAFAISGTGFTLLVKPERKLVICDNYDEFINLYASHPHLSLFDMVNVQSLSDEAFNFYNQQLQDTHHAKMMGLNSLLWQIYSHILPDDYDPYSNHLYLKVRFMPNFSIMSNTSIFYKNILASCLIQQKNIEELGQLFPHVTLPELDKLFLTAILSEIADIEVLQISHKNSMANSSPTVNEALPVESNKNKKPLNKGILKAKKNNLFKRFLKKLSI